eukprot:577852-Amphidinium_carterae.1
MSPLIGLVPEPTCFSFLQLAVRHPCITVIQKAQVWLIPFALPKDNANLNQQIYSEAVRRGKCNGEGG